MACALLIAVTLSGCATAGSGKLKAVSLPPAPVCMEPVAVPALRLGEDARAALARNRAALAIANGNIACSRQWYKSVQESYAIKRR